VQCSENAANAGAAGVQRVRGRRAGTRMGRCAAAGVVCNRVARYGAQNPSVANAAASAGQPQRRGVAP